MTTPSPSAGVAAQGTPDERKAAMSENQIIRLVIAGNASALAAEVRRLTDLLVNVTEERDMHAAWFEENYSPSASS